VQAFVNLDYDTGASNWILGDPEGWSEEKQKYFFTPVEGKEFGWQYAHHAVSVLPCGDILCFDNGTKRSKNKDRYVQNRDNYSRAVRYRINTENMTIEQVWEYGKELGGEFFSQFISNVDCYGEDHYLVHSGGIQLYDGLPSDKMLLGLDDPRARRESATICLKNGVKVLDMRIRGNFYRAKRLSLYHDNGSNLCTACGGKRVGQLAVTKMAELPAVIAEGEELPSSSLTHIVEHDDFVFLKARFLPEQQVFAVLEQGGNAFGYRVKTGDRFAQKNCLPYLEGDANSTSTLISKNGLNGQYDVKVMIDGKKYETGIKITC
jgi:arylsulfate sulfotransferase